MLYHIFVLFQNNFIVSYLLFAHNEWPSVLTHCSLVHMERKLVLRNPGTLKSVPTSIRFNLYEHRIIVYVGFEDELHNTHLFKLSGFCTIYLDYLSIFILVNFTGVQNLVFIEPRLMYKTSSCLLYVKIVTFGPISF